MIVVLSKCVFLQKLNIKLFFQSALCQLPCYGGWSILSKLCEQEAAPIELDRVDKVCRISDPIDKRQTSKQRGNCLFSASRTHSHALHMQKSQISTISDHSVAGFEPSILVLVIYSLEQYLLLHVPKVYSLRKEGGTVTFSAGRHHNNITNK